MALSFGVIFAAGQARAEPAGSARERFERGYALARAGDYEAAIIEFEAAYLTSPNFSVLFNLGQAYGAAGHAVEAANALERYLELGGTAIKDDQRSTVSALIASYRRRIGRLELHVEPAGAALWVDGKSVGTAPFSQPLEVTAGSHGISLSLAGYESASLGISVQGGQSKRIELALAPRERGAMAELSLECPLVDVSVVVDGTARGVTPLAAALHLPEGAHALSFSRAGYVTRSFDVQLTVERPFELSCDLHADPKAATARLRVEHPAKTRVTVDTGLFQGAPLPSGRHVVAVSGAGYQALRREVSLQAGAGASLLLVPLRESQALEDERVTRAKTQRLVAYAVGGAGLLTGTAALALLISNRSRYADWRAKDERFVEAFAKDPSSTSPRQLDELVSEENSIRNRDSLALGLGVAAGALLTTSAALYFTAGGAHPSLVITGAHAGLVTYDARF